MAVYEFQCRACGQRFEVKVPMREHERLKQEPPACPGCGKRETEQAVSLFSCKPASSF